jgi:hypothetical protein
MPEFFRGELTVTLRCGRGLPAAWAVGMWRSNPWCRLKVGGQALTTRRDRDTSHDGDNRQPMWNQVRRVCLPRCLVRFCQLCRSHAS